MRWKNIIENTINGCSSAIHATAIANLFNRISTTLGLYSKEHHLTVGYASLIFAYADMLIQFFTKQHNHNDTRFLLNSGWNLVVDVISMNEFFLRSSLFIDTDGAGGFDSQIRIDLRDFKKLIVCTAAIAIISNASIRKAIRNYIYGTEDRGFVSEIFDFIFEGLRGFAKLEHLLVSAEQIHDDLWSTTTGVISTVGRSIRYSVAGFWGLTAGFFSKQYSPNYSVADLFGKESLVTQTISLVNGVSSAFFFSFFAAINIYKNETPHKEILATLFTILPCFILLRFIIKELHNDQWPLAEYAPLGNGLSNIRVDHDQQQASSIAQHAHRGRSLPRSILTHGGERQAIARSVSPSASLAAQGQENFDNTVLFRYRSKQATEKTGKLSSSAPSASSKMESTVFQM